jgi:Arc/MetJ-type ribon-helix-helix transcriptional regulator
MGVLFTEEQIDLVRRAIQNGRYQGEEDALRDALSLWEARERRRAEILAAVDQAEASGATGAGRRVATQEEASQLAADIQRRGLARLKGEERPRS